LKNLPSSFAAHLASGVTTLATCWLVTRKDGQTLGFTDHDRVLHLNGTPCQPENGLTVSAMSDGPGFAIGGGDVAGQLSGPALAPGDLAAGLWDGAEIHVYRVNWQNPEEHILLRRAFIGELTQEGSAFKAELRGLSHLLEARQGRVFQQSCDADLGDHRCKVDLSDPAFRAEAAIGHGSSREIVLTEELGAYQADWFVGGRFKVLDGPMAGFASEVSTHTVSSGTAHLQLWQSLPEFPGKGTRFEVTAGCDKRFPTCIKKFANSANFQGFPHMPGSDFVLSYPSRNTGENDGGPLVS